MATPTCIEVTRHYASLSEKETEEVVGIVADMLVGFMKRGMPGGRSTTSGTKNRSQHNLPGRCDALGIAKGEAHGPQH